MVHTTEARNDVDNELLTLTITYYKYSEDTDDLAYDSIARGTPTTYNILAQINVQRIDSKYVMMGRVKVGEIVGVLRYEYFEEADGTEITPVLVPKKGNEVLYLERRFIIKECTPISSEDNSIIAWEITGGHIET